MSLLKKVVVFDSIKVTKFLKDVFGDKLDSEQLGQYYDYLYVRLNNGNSFSITIHNDINTIHVSIRRKWTSIHEDISEDFELLDCDIEDIIKNFIHSSLDRLNNAAKMPIQTTSLHTVTYSTY